MRSQQVGSWKAPEKWECPLDELEAPKSTAAKVFEAPFRPKEKRTISSKRQKSPLVEITHLQRSIRRMEAASQKIILQRLKEEWVGDADASVYRELELEKQLWMLSALRRLTKMGLSSDIGEVDTDSSVPMKILSLYENHGTSSLLCKGSMLISTSLLLLPLSPNKRNRSPPPLHLPTITKILPQNPTTLSPIPILSTSIRHRSKRRCGVRPTRSMRRAEDNHAPAPRCASPRSVRC